MMQNRNNDPKYLGQKYGRLTVIGFEKMDGKNGGWNWIVRCDCGKCKTILPNSIKIGRTRSCGCYHDERCAERAKKFKHNVYKNKRLYGIYNGVKRRCYKETDARYKDYGGRGIVMCEEWFDSADGFDRFVDWALSNGYDEGLTLERRDVNGNYSPDNCEWITLKDQAKNKRDTLWVDYRGEHIRLIDLCNRENVTYDTVHDRIYKRGWSVEDAVEKKSVRENSLMSKCRSLGLNYGTVRDRIVKLGWSEEEALSVPSAGRGATPFVYGHGYGDGTCLVCGKTFKKNTGKQIYCGARCRQISKSVKYRREHQR